MSFERECGHLPERTAYRNSSAATQTGARSYVVWFSSSTFQISLMENFRNFGFFFVVVFEESDFQVKLLYTHLELSISKAHPVKTSFPDSR